MCYQMSHGFFAKLEKARGSEELRELLTEISSCSFCC